MIKEVTEISNQFLYQIKHGFEEKDKPHASFFFQFKDKVVFIKKLRKGYGLMCSSQCGFMNPKVTMSVFDLLSIHSELQEAEAAFRFAIKNLIVIGNI